MSDTLMDQARQALDEQRPDDAQAILVNIIVREPDREQAWLLLAQALTDGEKKRECLERARAINPRNRAILRALEQLGGQVEAPGKSQSVTTVASPVPVRKSHSNGLGPLLERSEELAHALLLAVELPETRTAGSRLLDTLDEAAAKDSTQTRRWTRSAGRAALFKYEKLLTASIANLPRGDPQLEELRGQRQRALDYLRQEARRS